jgi:hypothetical protein
MAEVRDTAHEVRLRPVEDQDLDVFFDHRADPEAASAESEVRPEPRLPTLRPY